MHRDCNLTQHASCQRNGRRELRFAHTLQHGAYRIEEAAFAALCGAVDRCSSAAKRERAERSRQHAPRASPPAGRRVERVRLHRRQAPQEQHGLVGGLANGRFVAHPVAMTHGTVKFFKKEKGWGAISSPALPDGLDVWVHFSAIEGAIDGDGFRALEAGDRVAFEYEAVTQDSFRFRATRVRKL